MTEKRKRKGKQTEADSTPHDGQPSKIEYEVAKYLKSKLPEKRITLLGHKVDYFIASKAVDALLDSKWATGGDKTIFTTRQSIVNFMETMLVHKFFHRAKKVIVPPKEEKGKKKSQQEKKTKWKSDVEVESSAAEASSSPSTKKEKKGKTKFKLDMHLEQLFVDAAEPYVWIYSPIPLKTWFIGAGLVIGAILICLFPLWPRVVRTYVYYLSVVAAGFLFFIIGLAVIRFVVFCIVWGLTLGRHHFWMLPNLTEDVGFWASFWPLYHHEYRGSGSDKKKDEEDDDGDEEGEKEPLLREEEAGPSGIQSQRKDSDDKSSTSSRSSSTDKNGSENGFEILDSKDLTQEDKKDS